MRIGLLDNQKRLLLDAFHQVLPQAEKAFFAVAFMKSSGLDLIESPIYDCLDGGGQIEFIVGLDFHTTDALSLRKLKTIAEAHQNFSFFCYSDPSDNTRSYHPKLYLMTHNDILTSIIGSSNLTIGGLKTNVEINTIIDFHKDSEEAENLVDTYIHIKYQPTRFIPDDTYLDAYETVSNDVRKYKTPKSSKLKEALNLLRQQEELLPSPYISPDKLKGWQKLVFDHLPDEEFKTDDVYAYSLVFQEVFPENKNIEAKIRQQLQQLRDLGLLLHLGKNRWVKRPQVSIIDNS
ncbi:MAG: hypothetical protein KY468_05095 [Armatimonadetes bacterium]|nr:hypothetical protein [Armatimonadota bacterium]